MSDARIESLGDGHYMLHGELSFYTVPAVWSSSPKLASDDMTGDNVTGDDVTAITLDLKGITRTDSAGLALLIEWMRMAHHHKKKITFKNMPPQMLAMAKVSGLDSILPCDLETVRE